MINIAVTGANGQLGSEIKAVKDSIPNANFFFTDIPEMDITLEQSVDGFVKENNIDVIINCAAYTNVEKAENDRGLAMKINADGPSTLAKVAANNGATLVHVSTDYVFDGTAHTPYTEDVQTKPIGAYGETKLEGENAVIRSGCNSIIIRTSWLYSSFGNNFVKTMLRLGGEKKELKVIFDQVGTPTYARDLAHSILTIIPQILESPKKGEIYHFSNEGVCSWYDFSTQIMKLSKTQCIVLPIETSEYPTATARPNYSVLNKRKIKSDFSITIPHWEVSLERCLRELAK